MNDPGHGWLRVKYADVLAAGCADKISPYSYAGALPLRSDTNVYLEEDCDATVYLDSAIARGLNGITRSDEGFALQHGRPIPESHTNGKARCRDYQSYPARDGWRERMHAALAEAHADPIHIRWEDDAGCLCAQHGNAGFCQRCDDN